MKAVNLKKISILTALMVAIALFVSACGSSDDHHNENNNQHHGHTQEEQSTHNADKEEITQTMCPIMNAPINEDIYVEYEGKKVYFCCPGCEETFMEDPEKYMKELK